ncbi:biotin--[acetyl-CoA-carboxylase] ligase [Raineyella antarctica]|nr:biotin--[acetyl-CoA-carboxylase] ligase [Raineyella antarctica]
MPLSAPTDPVRLRERLLGPATGPDPTSGAGLWRTVEVVASTGSTNADASQRWRAGNGLGLVLVSDHQSAGRGRFDRRWQAPPGTAVAVSVVVQPRRPILEWMWLSLLTGVAIARGIRRATGVDATLKWPNDVLVEGRKICGILSERVEGQAGAGCIVGFGINVSLDMDELPVPTATSLALCGVEVDKADLVAEVLADWSQMYRLWDEGRLEELRAAYEESCSTIGRDVSVLLDAPGGGRRTVTGVAVGIGPTGEVLVRTPSGVEGFAAGDVTHLR